MSSLARVGRQLQQVATELEKVSQMHEVTVHDEGEKVTIATQLVPLLFVKEAVNYWSGLFGFTVPKLPEDAGTIAYFTKVFGQKRLERITKEIHCDGAYTKKEISRLFARLGEVFSSDLQELFDEIKKELPLIRFLSKSETLELRLAFAHVATLDDCSNAELDLLMNLLIPFQEIKHLFLNQPPSLQEGCFSAPKDFVSLKKRVYTYESIRREPINEREWMMHLAKTLADREIPTGTLFKNAYGGFCKVHQVVHAGGAYKYFLRTIGKEAGQAGNFILYRGTNPHPLAIDGWQTLVDDFRLKLGSEGAAATRTETVALLTDRGQGFMKEGNEKVTAIAMSLGGAHAMRDFADLKIDRLVTVASPGIDSKTCALFAQRVNANKYTYERSIVHFIEGEDVIDQFGEEHLGAGCNPAGIKIELLVVEPQRNEQVHLSLQEEMQRIGKLRKIFTEDTWHSIMPRHVSEFLMNSGIPNWISSIPFAAYELLKAIFTVHIRNTLLNPHRFIEISNQVNNALLQQLLSHKSELCDARWEQLRKILPLTLARARL